MNWARLANVARPGLPVLYHGLFYGTEEKLVLDEISAIYDGEVILAEDLDIFPARQTSSNTNENLSHFYLHLKNIPVSSLPNSKDRSGTADESLLIVNTFRHGSGGSRGGGPSKLE